MPKTRYLGLNLTTDDSISFTEWRNSIDGDNPETSGLSNMQIIDNAFGIIDDLLISILGSDES